jgi:hypothetical protein
MLFIEEELSSIFWLLLVSIGDSELATVSVSLLLEVFTLLLDDSLSSLLLEESFALDEDSPTSFEDSAELEEPFDELKASFTLLLEDTLAGLTSLELLLDLPMLLEDSFIDDVPLSLEDSGSAITDDDDSFSETGLAGLLLDPSSPQDNKTKTSNIPEMKCLIIFSI